MTAQARRRTPTERAAESFAWARAWARRALVGGRSSALLSGPEHVAMADALLMGAAPWPVRIEDRLAAAAIHAQLAQVQLMAAELFGEGMDPAQQIALAEQWRHVMRVSGPAEGIEHAAAAWADGDPDDLYGPAAEPGETSAAGSCGDEPEG